MALLIWEKDAWDEGLLGCGLRVVDCGLWEWGMGKWYWYTYEVGVLNESREKLCNCDGDGKLKMFGKRGVDGHRKPLCGG